MRQKNPHADGKLGKLHHGQNDAKDAENPGYFVVDYDDYPICKKTRLLHLFNKLVLHEKNFLDKMDGLGGDDDGRELIDDKLSL